MTIGPIENTYHAGVGYGSPAYERSLDELVHMGATWVSLTPFGRVGDLRGKGVDLKFEAPVAKAEEGVRRAIDQAHARGLKVFVVPHLWVESGDWRAEIDPKSDDGWRAWASSYTRFLLHWAKVAEDTHAEMLSCGVELRSWVTTRRAESFLPVIAQTRRVYHGLLTYSSNWDDAVDTIVWGKLDLIGINAFYPLGEKDGASVKELVQGGIRVRDRVRALSRTWKRPVFFTEIGYTTRKDPAIRPWEWPDDMKGVRPDQRAQAEAYYALLRPLVDEPRFLGFFVWRVYADPHDVSQEAEWGFSPRGKLAELIVRDAYRARWASDETPSYVLGRRAVHPGIFLE